MDWVLLDFFGVFIKLWASFWPDSCFCFDLLPFFSCSVLLCVNSWLSSTNSTLQRSQYRLCLLSLCVLRSRAFSTSTSHMSHWSLSSTSVWVAGFTQWGWTHCCSWTAFEAWGWTLCCWSKPRMKLVPYKSLSRTNIFFYLGKLEINSIRIRIVALCCIAYFVKGRYHSLGKQNNQK